MHAKNGFVRRTATPLMLGIIVSVPLLTGCSNGSPSAQGLPSPSSSPTDSSTRPTPTASKAPTASQTPTAPRPAPAQPLPATAEPVAPVPSPAEGQGEAEGPPRFMAEVPRMNVSTAEGAIEVLQKAFDYNPDLTYDAHANEYGTFDVTIRSLSIIAEGGSGAVGTYEVNSDGNYFMKSSVIR